MPFSRTGSWALQPPRLRRRARGRGPADDTLRPPLPLSRSLHSGVPGRSVERIERYPQVAAECGKTPATSGEAPVETWWQGERDVMRTSLPAIRRLHDGTGSEEEEIVLVGDSIHPARHVVWHSSNLRSDAAHPFRIRRSSVRFPSSLHSTCVSLRIHTSPTPFTLCERAHQQPSPSMPHSLNGLVAPFAPLAHVRHPAIPVISHSSSHRYQPPRKTPRMGVVCIPSFCQCPQPAQAL